MLKTILILIVPIIILFILCACKLATWSDKKMEENNNE